jgi:hypothetical protein
MKALVPVLLVLALAFVPLGASADSLSQYVLRADGTAQAGAWSPYPADGTLWNKTLSNDGDSSYITDTTPWSFAEFTVDNLAVAIPSGSSVSVCAWITMKTNVPGPSHTSFGLTNVNTSATTIWYDSSIAKRMTPGATTYKNYSITESHCPWTGYNWTGSTINATYFFVSFNGVGTMKITEIGLLVNVTVLTAGEGGMTDDQAMLFVTVILGLALMIYARYEKNAYLEGFSGIVWLFASLTVFPTWGEGWTILSLGLGMILLAHAGLSIADTRDKGSGAK